jgi:hypothetical protein
MGQVGPGLSSGDHAAADANFYHGGGAKILASTLWFRSFGHGFDSILRRIFSPVRLDGGDHATLGLVRANSGRPALGKLVITSSQQACRRGHNETGSTLAGQLQPTARVIVPAQVVTLRTDTWGSCAMKPYHPLATIA